MPLSAVLKWFRPLFWLGWKETLLLNKIHWFWACLCHKISQQVALSHATSVWKTRIVKGLVLRVKMCEHLTNYKFLTEIWSIFKEITNNLTTKNFSLVNNPLLTWRFSKTDIFCEKSSNYKHVYIQTLLERETFSLHNKMILGLLMPPFTTALGCTPYNTCLGLWCPVFGKGLVLKA